MFYICFLVGLFQLHAERVGFFGELLRLVAKKKTTCDGCRQLVVNDRKHRLLASAQLSLCLLVLFNGHYSFTTYVIF